MASFVSIGLKFRVSIFFRISGFYSVIRCVDTVKHSSYVYRISCSLCWRNGGVRVTPTRGFPRIVNTDQSGTMSDFRRGEMTATANHRDFSNNHLRFVYFILRHSDWQWRKLQLTGSCGVKIVFLNMLKSSSRDICLQAHILWSCCMIVLFRSCPCTRTTYVHRNIHLEELS